MRLFPMLLVMMVWTPAARGETAAEVCRAFADHVNSKPYPNWNAWAMVNSASIPIRNAAIINLLSLNSTRRPTEHTELPRPSVAFTGFFTRFMDETDRQIVALNIARARLPENQRAAPLMAGVESWAAAGLEEARRLGLETDFGPQATLGIRPFARGHEGFADAQSEAVAMMRDAQTGYFLVEGIPYPQTHRYLYRILAEEKHIGAQIRLYAKLRQRIETFESTSPNDRLTMNWFDDALEAYRAEGLNPAEAAQAAWDSFGFFGTQATLHTGLRHSLAARIADPAVREIVATSYHVFSVNMALAHHLDTLAIEWGDLGKLYTFPKEVPTECVTGKNYHFYLAGFIADRLRDQGSTPETASVASFALSEAYEVIATFHGRRPQDLLRGDAHTIAHRGGRINEVVNLAGGIFGARTTSGNLPIDAWIEAMTASAEPISFSGSLESPLSRVLHLGKYRRSFGTPALTRAASREIR